MFTQGGLAFSVDLIDVKENALAQAGAFLDLQIVQVGGVPDDLQDSGLLQGGHAVQPDCDQPALSQQSYTPFCDHVAPRQIDLLYVRQPVAEQLDRAVRYCTLSWVRQAVT